MATNICDCMSRRLGKKVLLVDIDPQFNSTQCLFVGDEYFNYLNDGKDTICTIFQGSVLNVGTVGGTKVVKKDFKDIEPYQYRDNWYLIPGNLNLFKIEMSAGEGKENRLKKFLKTIDEQYHFDYVIIDTPPTPSIWMTSALLASQYYVIPVKPEPLSYTGIDLLTNIIEEKKVNLDLDIECLGVILTMVEEGTLVYNKTIQRMDGDPHWAHLRFAHSIKKRTDVPKTQLNGQFILDLPHHDIKTSLVNIVDELIDRINEKETK